MRKGLASVERIEPRIVVLRGQKAMLSSDVARMYEVEPRALVRAVKRNIERFPSDFMFRLTWADVTHLKSKGVTPDRSGNVRAGGYGFTAPGVALLSSVLQTERAVQVHIAIIRTFARLRTATYSYRDLTNKLCAMEQKCDAQCRAVFDAIRDLLE